MPATTRSSRKRERDDSSSPKRSESSTATGRAPSANTSRRIPPTPVAAPWKGSIAEGWLWLSTLNAIARPSPASTTPAFSPGPKITRSPSVGSVRRSFLECLYAQCSDQRSEKTASSRSFGSRSSSSRIRSSSASVSPSVRARSAREIEAAVKRDSRLSATARRPSRDELQAMRHERLEERCTVRRPGEGVYGMLRVRHEAEHVLARVGDARDVVERSVGIPTGRVPQQDLTVLAQLLEPLGWSEVTADRMLDRKRKLLALAARAGERRARVLDDDFDLPADEAQGRIGKQRAGQQSGL